MIALLRRIKREFLIFQFNLRDFFDTYVSRSLPLDKTPYGFLLTGSNSNHHKSMQKGEFERDEVDWMLEQFKSITVFIDVGANIGYFSCLARAHGKHVIAIEPHYQNIQSLLKNIDVNDGPPVEVLPVGLSFEVGILKLYGLSSTGASLLPHWAGAPESFSKKVPVTTLDNIIGGRFLDEQLLIKIDVEGHEHGVIKGAKETLERSIKPIWLVEITSSQFHPEGVNPNFEKTFSEFWGLKYNCYALTQLGPELIDSLDMKKIEHYQESGIINYIFSG